MDKWNVFGQNDRESENFCLRSWTAPNQEVRVRRNWRVHCRVPRVDELSVCIVWVLHWSIVAVIELRWKNSLFLPVVRWWWDYIIWRLPIYIWLDFVNLFNGIRLHIDWLLLLQLLLLLLLLMWILLLLQLLLLWSD